MSLDMIRREDGGAPIWRCTACGLERPDVVNIVAHDCPMTRPLTGVEVRPRPTTRQVRLAALAGRAEHLAALADEVLAEMNTMPADAVTYLTYDAALLVARARAQLVTATDRLMAAARDEP